MDVLDLIRYNHHLWRRFADFYAEKLTWEQLSRNHETSHNTIANVSMHAVNMEDWWLHYVWPGKEWDGPKWDGFTDAKSMAARVRDVERKTMSMLAGLKPSDLAEKRSFDLGDGKFETSLETLLVELVNESTHHRGEVLAMLWRMDVEPPYESFLDWKLENP